MSDRLQTVAEDLTARGFDVTSEGNDLVASGGSLPGQRVDAPLRVIALRDRRPLTIIGAVAAAANAGQVPLLVADPTTAGHAREFLGDPFALAAAAPSREFYPVEDRILLRDDTYACVPAVGTLRWREAETGDDAGSDHPQLLLEQGDEIVAALDSVDALACPGPSSEAFSYRYDREPGGQFRVYDSDGLVGRYVSVTAMKRDYRPVPLPLVPAHHVRANGALARATVLATVDDGQVSYESERATADYRGM
jgi:hypothetical protein